MADSYEQLARDLEQWRAEYEVVSRAIADTLALLEKVDVQRRKHPEDRRRWDKRADTLELQLEDSRRRLNWLEQTTREAERKLAELSEVEGELPPREATPLPPRSDLDEAEESLAEQRQEAAQRVLSAPVFKLDEVPLEDYALAKAFLASKRSKKLRREHREELRRRIGIYDRRAERQRLSTRPRSRSTVEERRQQALLRIILDKCRTGSFATLTLGEIDLLIHGYDLIAGKPEVFGDPDRLLGLINDAVDAVCERWTKLDRLKSNIGSRS